MRISLLSVSGIEQTDIHCLHLFSLSELDNISLLRISYDILQCLKAFYNPIRFVLVYPLSQVYCAIPVQ